MLSERDEESVTIDTAPADADTHIVVVDDDREIRTLLWESLAEHGFAVSMAADTRQLDTLMRTGRVDLVILDIMMPGEDGIAACRRLRQAGGPPVILLSARGGESDRILGLETGASHYLPKPCSAREVLATVRAALRTHQGVGAREAVLVFSGWRMDLSAWELTDPEGVLIDLTDGEFAVLRLFVERPRRVLSREQLLEGARGPDSDAFDRAIDVQISRLRRKLRAPGDEMIRTVRNEGYMFVPAVTRR
ncbi:two-component system, OmpR family, response regulator [Sphingomonas sp. NFR15]|nr:two-component system, OmpR family, response regulator [Sphingomonas sp. NFR15]